MPHQTPLSAANLISFTSAAENTVNRWQASFGVALCSLASLMAAAFFSASARNLRNSCMQGGGCCCGCGGGWNWAAAGDAAAGSKIAAKMGAMASARRKRIDQYPSRSARHYHIAKPARGL